VRAIANPKVSQVLTNLGTTPTTNSPVQGAVWITMGASWLITYGKHYVL
jgi:hypothetical protein